MTDIIDQAQAFEAQNLQQSLAVQAAIHRNTPRLQAVGYCLSPRCGDDLDDTPGRLFCGPACAEEHQRLSRR